MADEPVNFKANVVIGSWRVSGLLGRGGQGGVWTVRPTTSRNSPPRAMKASFATEPKDRARFEREAKLLQGCASPLLLTVHEVEFTWAAHVEGLPEFAYYVADRCAGSFEQLQEHLGDAGVRINLFVEACRSVQYLHSLDEAVIHRDIKPANFLIAEEPRRVVLADLGIARYEALDSDLTAKYEVVGSKYYRPPEATNGDPGSVRGDIYSLGRVLEWLLTGEVSTNFATRKIARGDYLSDEICDALDRVILKSTQANAAERYGSVAELLAQIPDRWVAIRPRVASTDLPAPEDPSSIVAAVLDLVRRADTIGMRFLEQELRRKFPGEMIRWRQRHDKASFSEHVLPDIANDLVTTALGRIAFSLASVFSLQPAFIDQQRALNDLVTIPGWNDGGLVALISGPRSLAYVFHYLHGALCAELGRWDLALSVASVILPHPRRNQPTPLWRQRELTSAPKTFGDDPRVAWKYLTSAPTRFPVLGTLFALERDFEVALASYSMLLMLFEFAHDAATLLKRPENDGMRFDVDPMFREMTEEVVSAAARRTFGSREVVDLVLARSAARRADLVGIWPRVKDRLNSLNQHNRPWVDDLPIGDLA